MPAPIIPDFLTSLDAVLSVCSAAASVITLWPANTDVPAVLTTFEDVSVTSLLAPTTTVWPLTVLIKACLDSSFVLILVSFLLRRPFSLYFNANASLDSLYPFSIDTSCSPITFTAPESLLTVKLRALISFLAPIDTFPPASIVVPNSVWR